MKKFRGVAVGAGYFSQFQYEAWNRIPEVEIVALCNRNVDSGKSIQQTYGIARHYTDYKEMIDAEQPDFIDIITPPETHLDICSYAAERGIHIICQKPLAPSMDEAIKLVEEMKASGVRFMVHENWRFQPWYRQIKQLLDEQLIGQVHTVYFRSRMGDGWGENAYIPRQPYFRDYPRLLIYENGIHFIDTFRYLFGKVERVNAHLRKLNQVIKGEDWAQVQFEFDNGIFATWDASRYNEPNYPNSRYTFGEMLIDGMNGSIRLYPDGMVTVQQLGQDEETQDYTHQNVNFAGDCVFITQRHFVDGLLSGQEFETNGVDYLKSLEVQEAIYDSAQRKIPVKINQDLGQIDN
ncbi:Gfo/Idh/MocA family protein [Reichenbachiella ulvae]|uniref:Gfo/Idh/MocA family oxidoreductase n=1 Tax=Reichenbachiella ulvae TaxID=2980104 RepID=A0ABT3CSP5_9BACT|nr:Gfo/Idh/MocA family oxidoreductase [Reichenbachiella ulvae]MCV9386703.1 Gfo/Idh/MocA family oxidoreductase [Reichenbachiella ulvae]